MWELIASNKRKSVVLITVMAMLMIGAGMLIGEAIAPGAWLFGGLIALALWTGLSLVSYYGGDSVFLASVGARQIEKRDHPTLYNIVEEMRIASGLSNMPKIYIVDDPRPNAFAVGRDPEHASVAVTAGLLNRLNRDEVQGVVAHELAHIQNRDTLYVMVAAVMVGVIALMSDVFLRYLWFAGGRRRSRSSGGGQAQAILMLAGILLAILGPIAAQLLYFALSRRREYLADACGALSTRYPEGLASALEKISRDPGMKEKKNRAMAPMYIVNPSVGIAFAAAGLTSTHPPTDERVRILRSMGGASLADYEQAFSQVRGERIVPASVLKTARPVGVRPPWREKRPAEPEPGPREKARETADLLWRLNQYAFVSCACGARLKIPPGYKRDQVACPRCERVHDVRQARAESGASISRGAS
jgi:heat shock protein HtpX